LYCCTVLLIPRLVPQPAVLVCFPPPLLQIGTALGYHGLGLGALTHQVLGSQPPKCRKVTMSNWEQKRLTAKQVQYAALDAILTGNVYRSLRLWHASPSACTSCHQMLGAVSAELLRKSCAWCMIRRVRAILH
jgi:hypothetical protein